MLRGISAISYRLRHGHLIMYVYATGQSRRRGQQAGLDRHIFVPQRWIIGGDMGDFRDFKWVAEVAR